MNIFQIPIMEDNTSQNVKVIGIIDSSGSMSSYWKYLANQWNQYMQNVDVDAFCFDDKVHPVEGSVLHDNINQYGGSMTDIYKAFQHFENMLDKLPEEQPVVVIFISDGGHNVGGDITKLLPKLKGNTSNRKINFLCLGVGKSFPTFISMTLREKYHRGDQTLPAIFLIEFVTEEAFKIKFESMKPFFTFNRERKITPAVTIFPWLEKQDQVYENSWVMTNESKVVIDEEEIEVDEFNLNLTGIQEIFRSWGQKIQIDRLKNKNENHKQKAITCLKIMDEILQELKTKKNIDLLEHASFDMASIDQKMSFKERSWKNFLKRNYERTSWYYNDMKELAETDKKVENEFEAAKKIMVGTVVGNYKKKIQGLKNNTNKRFNEMKQKFKDVYKSLNLKKEDNEDPFNQRTIFVQQDFLKGLDNCKNIFDLIESFPIIGISTKITAGSYNVNEIFNTEEVVNSTQIVHNNGAYILKKDKTMSINCIIPYLQKDDKECAKLFQTELFQVLMTYQILKDADKFDMNSLVKILKVGILKSMDLKDEFGQSVQKRLQNTLELLVPDKENIKSNLQKLQYEEISECFADLYLAGELLSKQEIERVLDKIAFKIFQDNQPIDRFYEFQQKQIQGEINKKSLKQQIKDYYKEFRTRGQFERKFKELTISKYQKDDLEPVFMQDQIKNLQSGVMTMQALEGLAKKHHLDIDYKNQEKFIAGIFLNKSFEQIEKEDAQELINLAKSQLLKAERQKSQAKNHYKKVFSNQKFLKKQQESYQDFQNYFKEIHQYILPISQEEFSKIELSNTDKKLQPRYNKESNLSSNVCLAKDCGFYGKVTKRLSHHFDIFGKYPKGFHLFVKNNLNLSNEQLLKKFLDNNGAKDIGVKEKYGYTEEEFLKYVELLKEQYNKILN